MKKTLLLAVTVFCLSNLINAQAGHLDPSFGNHGVVKTDLGVKYDYGAAPATKLLLQPDGSVYAVQGGDYYGNAVSKRLPDGSADTSFGIKGTIKGTSVSIMTAAIQPDGKIVTAGSATVNGTSVFAVARYNTNGSLDSSFAGDGIQTIHISSVNTGDYNSTWETANLIAIQKDGKIIIAGLSSLILSIVRYNTDGSLDRTFDGDGLLQSLDYYFEHTRPDPPTILTVQNDGKIVVGGGTETIVRYNSDGSPDNSFSMFRTIGISSLAVQSDGKMVAEADTGYYDYEDRFFSHKPVFTRINVDGSPDSSFSDDGFIGDVGGSIAIQNDGKILLINTGWDTTVKKMTFNIDRYNVDGSLDNTFPKDGKRMTGFDPRLPAYGPGAMTGAIQSDGKIVVGGGTAAGYDKNYNHYSGYFALVRFNKDGSVDSSFGKDGKVTDSTFYAGNTVYDQIVIRKDKKIVVGGNTWNGSEFAYTTVRYNTDGSVDSIFLNNSIKQMLSGKSSLSMPWKNTNVMAAGERRLTGNNRNGNLNEPDTNKKQKNITSSRSNKAEQKDGKTVSVESNVVTRYNADGSLDKTFGADGHQTLNFTIPGHSYIVNFISLGIQSDEKIVLGGAEGDLAIIRLNTNGSFDSTFGEEGYAILKDQYDYETQYFLSCSVLIQNNDKVIIGADLESVGVFLARLNVDGSIDSTFNETPDLTLVQYDIGSSFKLQKDEKIVAGGGELLRYNTDGSVDRTFNINAYQQIDFAIRDMAISDNKLYVVGGGYFGTIARYLLDTDSSSNTPPTVSLTSPANNGKYLAPATIKLSAAASDSNGTITKVEFYKGSTLLHTETAAPYDYVWRNVPAGNYKLTAKAYDNSGNITTSAPVHISVVANKAPAVSIVSPADNQIYTDTANIHLVASAADTDGRITKVAFYNGTVLLRTEYKYPYTYNWKNVTAGTYTITAIANDNRGAQTNSTPVTITVTSTNAIVSSRPYSKTEKTASNDALRLRLSPNPANNFIDIYTNGLQQNKPATISIISSAGIVLKTMQISQSSTQLNVSSLASGVYTIKIVSGEKVLYKQFVKL